jgi:hypothetical protein
MSADFSAHINPPPLIFHLLDYPIFFLLYHCRLEKSGSRKE